MNFFNHFIVNKKSKYLVDVLDKNVDLKYYIKNKKFKKYLKNNFSEYTNKTERKIIKELDLPREVHNDLERQRRVYSIFGISPTLLARSDSPKIILNNNGEYEIRKITPLEALKIQGFDNKYVENVKKANMSDTQLYKQAGNAVSPPVITEIINKLIEMFYEEI